MEYLLHRSIQKEQLTRAERLTLKELSNDEDGERVGLNHRHGLGQWGDVR